MWERQLKKIKWKHGGSALLIQIANHMIGAARQQIWTVKLTHKNYVAHQLKRMCPNLHLHTQIGISNVLPPTTQHLPLS